MSEHCTVFFSFCVSLSITDRFLSWAGVSEESKRKCYFQGFLGGIYSGRGGPPGKHEKRERFSLPSSHPPAPQSLCRMKTEEEGASVHGGCPRKGQSCPAECVCVGGESGGGEDRKQQ